ncbi:MAG: hypothetical protein ACK5LC_02870 [Coprobacillaceae bacterium]
MQKARELSENKNLYKCSQISNENENEARCVVEERTKDQEDSYLEILTNNSQIVTAEHVSQTRTGFSDGIYGDNNFAEQYNVKGELDPNTVYQYRMEFDPQVSTENLSDDQLTALEYYGANLEVSNDEYATILNPHASYQTLYDAKLANQYSHGLVVGSYPQDKSDQVMVSTIVAEQICASDSKCNNIKDLLNQELDVELVGVLQDGSESKIIATFVISGVYSGQTTYNDIILAYDGLNDNDSKSNSELPNQTLVDSYKLIDQEIDASQADSSADTDSNKSLEHEQ